MWRHSIVERLTNSGRQLPALFIMPYNPIEYWTERGMSEDNFQINIDHHLNQREKLRMLLQQLGIIKSVLEIGCGNGRLTAELFASKIEIEEYVGIDISQDRIDRLQKRLESGNIQLYNQVQVQFFAIPFEKLNLHVKKDLVFASEVLLHVKPEDIEVFMRRMINHCSGFIVHIDWWQKDYIGDIAEHNFRHDYETLWTQLGQRVEIIPISDNQAMFVVKM